jgi:branched-subunit amino acid transport protein
VTLGLILLLAALTYGSRMLALVALPPPARPIERILNRVPAPLFAGLAALSLVDTNGELSDAPVLVATAGALCAAPFRSFLGVLAAGLLGYALGAVIF